MTPLLYSLHSGNLYGTERMALATALGLRDEFETTFVAPEGPFHAEASRIIMCGDRPRERSASAVTLISW